MNALSALVRGGLNDEATQKAARSVAATFPAAISEGLEKVINENANSASDSNTNPASTVNAVGAHVEELNALQEQVQTLTQQNATLVADKDALTIMHATTAGELAALQKQNAALQKQLDLKADEFRRGMEAGVQSVLKNMPK